MNRNTCEPREDVALMPDILSRLQVTLKDGINRFSILRIEYLERFSLNQMHV